MTWYGFVCGLGLAACAPMADHDPQTPGVSRVTGAGTAGAAACDTGVLGRLVGRDDSIFEVMDLQENVRLIYPEDAINDDYRPDRINIDIDAGGTITRVWCG